MLIQNRSGKLLEADAQVKYISTVYNVWDTNIYMSSKRKRDTSNETFPSDCNHEITQEGSLRGLSHLTYSSQFERVNSAVFAHFVGAV